LTRGETMPFVLIGGVFVLLKWLEVEPIATWSWWWVLAPLMVAFVWFEFLESLFGRDRRSLDQEESKRQIEERNRRVWGDRMPPTGKAARSEKR
jgi:small Trp-rich protein